MRRIFIILLCAFMVLSHGGIVAAHSHDSDVAAHDDHGGLHASDHDDDHDRAATDGDADTTAPHSTIAHSHAAVDVIARAPMLARANFIILRVEPPLLRDADPPSAIVLPGLEPPDA